ncbi:uncharacterized protein HMPREF1541_01619 [Cyphellophora europaea CBS 101466]|uniref:Uncharacterized protein n=1 Tax=Cyphellophora europaea (strain CBS 101466) TaxID=1220924 RepID=W2S355_CYPE1|nr:uncharacterized protein HMPREF1541_01619 [Cyphellophora europaea CBS 101466]ETN42463.1 hypothetical protein HMPREF1541_01619 [Cyphellophora europaea CBS 101466]
MVDRAVQTIAAVPANRNSVLRQPSGLAVPDMEEPESPERETDNDTEMELDDGSSYSDGTVEDEMYHDLFEEFHSALL